MMRAAVAGTLRHQRLLVPGQQRGGPGQQRDLATVCEQLRIGVGRRLGGRHRRDLTGRAQVGATVRPSVVARRSAGDGVGAATPAALSEGPSEAYTAAKPTSAATAAVTSIALGATGLPACGRAPEVPSLS